MKLSPSFSSLFPYTTLFRSWDGSSKIPIAGIAFAGARGIAKVEVSTDGGATFAAAELEPALGPLSWVRDRKSTRLNSSHRTISYAVFCLKKKNRRTHI